MYIYTLKRNHMEDQSQYTTTTIKEGELVYLRTNPDITYCVIGWVTMCGHEQVIISNEEGISYRYECEIERVKATSTVKGFKK